MLDYMVSAAEPAAVETERENGNEEKSKDISEVETFSGKISGRKPKRKLIYTDELDADEMEQLHHLNSHSTSSVKLEVPQSPEDSSDNFVLTNSEINTTDHFVIPSSVLEDSDAVPKADQSKILDEHQNSNESIAFTSNDVCKVEFINLARKSSHSVSRLENFSSNDRWQEEWNGRKNFKKFKKIKPGPRKATHNVENETSNKPSKVTLVEFKPNDFGIGDDYWAPLKERKINQRSQEPRDGGIAGGNIDTEASAQKKVVTDSISSTTADDQSSQRPTRTAAAQILKAWNDEVSGDDEGDEHEEESSLRFKTRTAAKKNRRQAPAKLTTPKKATAGQILRDFKAQVIEESESDWDDDNDGLKFRFK
ncbi:hypothetical protein V1514DRAFT_328948 [Lipomyces japonicus]|uniref:uncharacterized protein n=1 Tax=Lipomyces japonicus TaxID=56871 RepID=UPI0034CE8423